VAEKIENAFTFEGGRIQQSCRSFRSSGRHRMLVLE
jgi:hypothetical protein